MPTLKNSNATFWVIFKQCAKVPKPVNHQECQTDQRPNKKDCDKDHHCKRKCGFGNYVIGGTYCYQRCIPNMKPPKIVGCRHNYDCKWTEGEACNIKVKTEDLIEG